MEGKSQYGLGNRRDLMTMWISEYSFQQFLPHLIPIEVDFLHFPRIFIDKMLLCCLQVFRKTALMLVEQGGGTIKVSHDDLKKFVGNPVFNTDRIYDETPPGVSIGLAWTSMGRYHYSVLKTHVGKWQGICGF